MAKSNGKISEAGYAVRTVIFIGVAVMAVILIIGGIYLFQIKSNEKKSDQTQSPNDIVKDFSALIAEGSEQGDIYVDPQIAEIMPDKAFALCRENSSYYHECTVTAIGSDGTRLERIKRILRDGDRINIRTYNKNTLIETVKCDGTSILVVNETTGKSNKIPLDEETCPMELASMPCHESLLSLTREYDSGSEDSVISDCTYTFERTRDMNMLTVNITYRDSGIKESYYYYLNYGNYGIIYNFSSSTPDGEVSYKMNTTFFSRSISDFITEDSFDVS